MAATIGAGSALRMIGAGSALRMIGACSALGMLGASSALGQTRSSIKFSCDFRVYGGTSPFFYGLDAGFFRDQGIDAQVDGSLGSADAVTRVASGAYDFGCADVSTLVEFASRNPTVAPKLIMPIYDRFPGCIISLKAKPVHSIKELEGITLGISTSDAGSRMLPALLRLHGVDRGKINIVTLEQRLRDTMLISRQVDAVIGFDYTTLFNLAGNNIPKEDVVLVYYSDNGFNFYGQGLIAARRHIDGNPELVKGVAAAVTRSWLETARHRDAAIAGITRRDALANGAVERARLDWVLDRLVLTQNVRTNGLGTMDLARLQAGLKFVAEGFALPQPVAVDDIFDGRFMPPIDQRRVV
jgi:NitT/TauT family transport system substrate-binding protein